MNSKLLTGFAIGLAVGILLAPEKGSETRKKIAQKSSDLKDKFSDFVDSLADKFDSLKDEASDLGNKGKAKAQSFANDAGNAWNNQS